VRSTFSAQAYLSVLAPAILRGLWQAFPECMIADFAILNSTSIPNRASNTTVSGYRSHED
ncbi:hypothetical protein PIB30_101406, partial [Stylosanthes scabra]|nr:hypothetical protein [Stylosanthes scabra]